MHDPAVIDRVTTARAAGTVSLQLAWKGALESLPPLPAKALETVALAMPSPDSMRQLGRYLAREQDPEGGLLKLLREADESDEPLEEWLQAFEVLACFLESTPHRPSLSTALGYLHCCQAISHTGARYATFPMTVETMLETYGYSGEEDR